MLEMTAGRRRWLLFVNIVAISLGVATMSALYTSLPDIAVATGATQAQLTWIVDSYTLALAALVLTAGALGDRFGLGLIEGAHTSWNEPLVIVALSVATVSLFSFVLVELRADDPLLDVRYFRSRGFTAGSVSVGMQFLTIFGFFLLIVQYLQLVKGYDAISTSLALAPMVVPVLVFSLLSPRITKAVGLRAVSVVGVGAIAAGMILLSGLDAGSTYWDIL